MYQSNRKKTGSMTPPLILRLIFHDRAVHKHETKAKRITPFSNPTVITPNKILMALLHHIDERKAYVHDNQKHADIKKGRRNMCMCLMYVASLQAGR